VDDREQILSEFGLIAEARKVARSGFQQRHLRRTFDTSVFDPDHGLQEAQEPLVLDALRSQRLRLIFDLDGFLEPLLAFGAITAADATPKAARQLQRMLNWCDLRRVVRVPEWLLADAVLSYAGRAGRVEEFLNAGQLDEEIERELRDWDSVRRSSVLEMAFLREQRSLPSLNSGMSTGTESLRPSLSVSARTSIEATSGQSVRTWESTDCSQSGASAWRSAR
jgi:hypothetical protein